MKILWIAAMAMILCGCAADPYSQIAAGQAALEATQAARRQANEYATRQAGAVAGQQTRDAGAVQAVQMAAQGTALAQTAAVNDKLATQTRTAEDLELKGTEIALAEIGRVATATAGQSYAQSTLDARAMKDAEVSRATAISGQATATAAAMARRVSRERWGYGLFFVAFSLLCMGLIGIVLFLAWRMQELLVQRYKVQTRILEMMAEHQRRMEMAQLQLPAGEVIEQPIIDDEMTEFMLKVIEKVGENGVIVPRWDAMEMHPNAWTELTNRLAAKGAVIKTRGKRTVINSGRFRDVGEIYRTAVLGKL